MAVRAHEVDAVGHGRLAPGETPALGPLGHALVCDVLAWLQAADLARCACVCRTLQAFCTEEPLWMLLALRDGRREDQARPPSRRRATWRMSYIVDVLGHAEALAQRPQARRPEPRPVTMNSPFLSNRWLRCNAQLEGFLPQEELVERLVHGRDARLEASNFFLEFDAPRRPVMIEGATDRWPCRSGDARHDWTLDGLARRFGSVNVDLSHTIDELGKLQMPLADYAAYVRAQRDEAPLYLFDADFGGKAPPLLQEYDPTIGGLFSEDLLGVLDKRPPHKWLVVGPERTGAPWHKDPTCTSAWNALVHGRKRWALYPPGRVPPGVQVEFSDELQTSVAHVDTPSSLRWYLEVYPALSAEERPLEIVQGPGDVLFIPSGWWHLVLNLEMTVSVTHNFVNMANLRAASQDLYEEGGAPFLEEFEAGLRRQRPDLWDKLRPTLGALQEGFDSELEFAHGFGDVARWQPLLEGVLAHHGLAPAMPRYEALTKRVNPTFLEATSALVIKLFSHLACSTGGFGADTVELPDAEDGEHAQRAEAAVLRAAEGLPAAAWLPRLRASGVYYGAGYGALWRWPYVVMSRVPGATLRDVLGAAAREKNAARRWRLARWRDQLARELGPVVAALHGLGAARPQLCAELGRLRGGDGFAAWLCRQRKYALAAHWRKALVPRHLLLQAEQFVDRVLPSLLRRAARFGGTTVLHGDLQLENIMVEQLDDEAGRTRAFLLDLWGDEPRMRQLVDDLVDRQLLRLSSLAALSDSDLAAAGVPLGPRALLRNKAQLDGLDRPGTGAWALRFAGIIDLADARLGDPLYDLVALHVGAFRLDCAQLGAFVSSYERAAPGRLSATEAELPALLMCLTLLHQCDAAGRIFEARPSLRSAPTWDAVASSVFGVKPPPS